MLGSMQNESRQRDERVCDWTYVKYLEQAQSQRQKQISGDWKVGAGRRTGIGAEWQFQCHKRRNIQDVGGGGSTM